MQGSHGPIHLRSVLYAVCIYSSKHRKVSFSLKVMCTGLENEYKFKETKSSRLESHHMNTLVHFLQSFVWAWILCFVLFSPVYPSVPPPFSVSFWHI